MPSLLKELRHRNVFTVGAVSPLNLPDWFDTVAIRLLAIGFPIAVITSWAFDLTYKGQRERQLLGGSGCSLTVNNKLDP